nr:uncharacterized protein LOC129039973 isoform X3 [Pongo pygmaeus]
MSPYFIPILYSRKQEFVDICKSLCFGVSHSSACSVLSNLFYVANACSFLIAQPIYCLLQEAFLNPPVSKVYMDIKIGNKPAGCIQTLVRSDVVPMTAENFCYLCTHLKDLASREAASTALSPSSRARAVISQTTAAPGASPSTRRNLMMKTLSSNTQDQVCAGMALSVPWHIWPSWRPQKGRTSTLFYRGRNGHSSSRLGGLLDDSSRLLPSLRAAPGSTSTSVLPRITCLVELPSPDRRCQLHGWFASVPTDSLR